MMQAPENAHRYLGGIFMHLIRRAVAIALLAAAVPGAAHAKDKLPELSAAELAPLQTRTFKAPFQTVMSSAVAALQTGGYLNIQASKDAGTVSGQTDAKSKLMFNIFWGLGKKKYTQTAQFLVEEIQPGQTTLRLNLFLNESKTRSIIFGSRMTDGLLIRQGEPYSSMMALVTSEVRKRQPQPEPEAAAAPTAASAAGAASSPTPNTAVKCVTCQ